MSCLRPHIVTDPNTGRMFPAPCGKCEECCKAYSLQWAQRMMDELSITGKGMFLTLTYDNVHLPPDGQLRKRDLQLFMKRLRKHIAPEKCRYYACGEYGGHGSELTPNGRPHYHICLFGWIPKDLTPRNEKVFVSHELEQIWQNGFIHIYELDFARAKYAAKYLSKLDDRDHAVKPFSSVSLKPGLGASVVTPALLSSGHRYIDGRKYPIPKYYIKLLERDGYNTAPLLATRAVIADQACVDHFGSRDAYNQMIKQWNNRKDSMRAYAPVSCH